MTADIPAAAQAGQRRPVLSIAPLYRLILLLIPLVFLPCTLNAETGTRVIMLGTGTPVPDPQRNGPGVAVVTGGKAYVFDAGGGMVKQTIKAAEHHGLDALVPQQIEHLFITHMHSDHIHDINELASARWWARSTRLQVHGPAGIRDYVGHMHAMAGIEADLRRPGTPPELITDREGYRAEAHEISPGTVFENDDIRIEAFAVDHGDIEPAYGYRVETADRTIVISGDTTYNENVLEQARDADILIHEVISGERLATMNAFWQDYHGSSHTTTDELARLAGEAEPGLLVLYHILFQGATRAELINEMEQLYDGQVILAEDLDIF